MPSPLRLFRAGVSCFGTVRAAGGRQADKHWHEGDWTLFGFSSMMGVLNLVRRRRLSLCMPIGVGPQSRGTHSPPGITIDTFAVSLRGSGREDVPQAAHNPQEVSRLPLGQLQERLVFPSLALREEDVA